jgi:hypothetical protein
MVFATLARSAQIPKNITIAKQSLSNSSSGHSALISSRKKCTTKTTPAHTATKTFCDAKDIRAAVK